MQPIKALQNMRTASIEFQCKNIVICQQQNPPLHTLPVSSIFIYLSMKDLVKHQRRCFCRKKAANQGLFYPFIDKSTMPFQRNEMPCYLLKSPKTHAPLGEYRVLSTVNLEKLRMKLHNYALLPNFLELSLLSLLIKSNYLKLISIIRRIQAN